MSVAILTTILDLLLEFWVRMDVSSIEYSRMSHISTNNRFNLQPRVPVQGLANIVPPSEPDSQIPLVSAIHSEYKHLTFLWAVLHAL